MKLDSHFLRRSRVSAQKGGGSNMEVPISGADKSGNQHPNTSDIKAGTSTTS